MRKNRPYQWIDTPEGVQEIASEVEASPIIGLDTESDSFHHYQEQVCLIQLCTEKHDFLLDTVAVKSLGPLKKLLADKKREVVINGADYDIVCLKRDFGIKFGRIFDTALAAQFLGYPATGLSALLERHFGVKVSKAHQRDEWFQRPLKPSQIEYALNDIRYLLPLKEKIESELKELGRLEWVEEEFSILTRREWTRPPFTPDDFWRIRGSRDMPGRDQAILRELAVARDRRARSINRPPFKVISDSALKEIAKNKPRSPRGLRKVRGVSDLMIRRFGEDLIDAVARGLDLPQSKYPVPARGERRPGDPAVSRRLEKLKVWRKGAAAGLKLDPGVLAPLTTLKAIARTAPRSVKDLEAVPEITRWRTREFGKEWVEVLKD